MAVDARRRREIPAVALHPPELDKALYRVQVFGDGHQERAGDQPSSSSDDDNVEDEVVLPRSGSNTTRTSFQRRSLSPSDRSASTTATSHSSHEQIKGKRMPLPSPRPSLVGKALTTTDYHVFLAQAEHPPKSPVRSIASPPLTYPLPSPTFTQSVPSSSYTPASLPAPSLAPSSSSAQRKPYENIRRRLTKLSRPKGKGGVEITHCTRCRRGTRKSGTLQLLDCGHRYCNDCLHQLIMTVMRTARTIPVTCCKQSVPAVVLKQLLSADEQYKFVRMVVELDTARRRETSCPECQEELLSPDSEFALEMACGGCNARDWSVDILWHMCVEGAWIQCKQCTRIHLVEDRQRIVCGCEAEICSGCGSAIPSVGRGCSTCDAGSRLGVVFESAVDDGRLRNEVTAVDAMRLLEQLTAKARSLANPELRGLRRSQLDQQRRFLAFEQKQKWIMWTRHGQKKVEMFNRHSALEQRLQDKHAEAANRVEERHLAAEMELRQTLEQEERACKIRLRHMEDYCNMAGGVGPPPPTPPSAREPLHRPYTPRKDSLKQPSFPARTITERDLRELQQQYHLRDDMSRLHSARINVLRDTQARQLETLEKKQHIEMQKLIESTFEPEIEALETMFAQEETKFEARFWKRREKLKSRWKVEEEYLRGVLQKRMGKRYGPLPEVSWEDGGGSVDELDEALFGLTKFGLEQRKRPQSFSAAAVAAAKTSSTTVRLPSSRKIRWSYDGFGTPSWAARQGLWFETDDGDQGKDGARREGTRATRNVGLNKPSPTSSFLLL
ncbi:MAG: hypothetical protein M1823_004637 [Watsoniomyces obsoletus]|nr:MAG: hypothetical protein M1823_004637 [Watsoniomyces obsoletus]